MVGAGGGVASAGAFGIATKVGRGQRAQVFAKMFVAAYLGLQRPGPSRSRAIAVRTSFATGFISIIVFLALIVATLPFLTIRKGVTAKELAPAA